MNSLCQNENGLIGSAEDVESLAKQDSVSILVLSDSHADYEAVSKIIEEFGSGVDALVFCGDGNCDIIKYIQESLKDKKMQENLPSVIALVRGNCDSDHYYLSEDEEAETKAIVSVPLMISFEAAGRNVFVSHGNRHGVSFSTDTLEAAASSFDSDFVFFGHTHCPEWEDSAGSLILNPGSCSQPRGNEIPSFAVVHFPCEAERYSFQFYGIEKNVFGKIILSPVTF